MKPLKQTLTLLSGVLILLTQSTLHADLEPLKYNNPGLKVNLGVGLWAWPMPMDYDGDGDMDLLVACPDKPSNGVYFFENPTQDPKAKMPVFKPGVRLGPAVHNMQVSYVDGKLQVLCRSKRAGITTSWSDDQGKTWRKMEKTGLPNPNAGIDVVSLIDGRFLMIYNHLGSGKTGWGRRGLLNLAISNDGKEWRKVAILEQEEKAEFSYPAIIQTEDGLVHISYTWKRQRIKHVVLDPGKIKAGEVLSMENWHKD